jgi:hypothetical protein
MKDEYGSISASRHGMTGLQARQSGVDGIPIAQILTLIQVLQEFYHIDKLDENAE